MGSTVVGRAAELEAIEALLESDAPGATALVLDGEAGIGKTTVWLAGLERGRERGYRVLSCRPSETEVSLPYVSLGDLLEPVLDDAAEHPALDAALGRGAQAGAPERLEVSRATLAVLRSVAGRGPVLVAIDDVQWLDPASEAVLEFAARRIAELPVRLLVARRSERDAPAPLGLPRAIERLTTTRVGPLEPGELDGLLRSTLDLRLPRPRLLELHRISGGNPFYALEIGRALARRRSSVLSVPETLGDLLRDRLAALSPEARESILLAAAASLPTSGLIEKAVGGTDGLAGAVRHAVLEIDGERIRFTHPLLASVAYESAAPWDRRAAHRRLAEVTPDREERARHLALCTDETDETIASELEATADTAASRGVPEAAARLAEHAARLTPPDRDDDRRRRLTRAAECHIASGDPERARAILEDLIAGLPPGPRRADLLWRLADAVGDNLAKSIRLCEEALDEAGDDPALRARIHTALGVFTWIAGDLIRSADHCRAAAELGEEAGDKALVAMSLGEVCHAATVLGLGYRPEDMERALELECEIDSFPTGLRPSFQLAVISVYTDELDAARPLLLAELARVEAAGDEAGRFGVLFRLVDLELRGGNWGEAARLSREALALGIQAGIEQEQGTMLVAHALVQAHLGNVDEALEAAETALSSAEASGDRPVAIRALGVLGFVELSRGRPEAALGRLSPARAQLQALGTGELSISQVVNNEIEALVAVGQLDEAEATIVFVEEKGRPSGRSWHRVVGERGRALVAAARGDYESARGHLERALAEHEQLPQPFELGRTLLVQGSVERRAKHRGRARQALTRALELFDSLGAPLWAEKAAAELARIPGRAPSSGELSETEARVADLVARGHSNKEIAAKLFVTVRTVEANLSRIYAKLQVRSRTELASRLSRPAGP